VSCEPTLSLKQESRGWLGDLDLCFDGYKIAKDLRVPASGISGLQSLPGAVEGQPGQERGLRAKGKEQSHPQPKPTLIFLNFILY